MSFAAVFTKKRILPGILIGFLFAFTLIFGWALETYENLSILVVSPLQILLTILGFIVLWIFGFAVTNVLFYGLDVYFQAPSQPSTKRPLMSWPVLAWLFDYHAFLGPLILLFVVWTPLFCAYAPGLFMGDIPTIIREWFGEPRVANTLPLINPDVVLNQHHPVVFQALLGLCIQLGQLLFNSENSGILFYTTLQYAATLCTLAYGFYCLKQFGVKRAVRIGLLVFVLIVPVFSLYAVLITKDVLFSDGLLLLLLQLAKLIFAPRHIKSYDWILLIVGALAVTFFRNGGFLFAFVGLIAVLIFAKQTRKPLALSTAFVTVVFAFVTYGLFPMLQITPGSSKEVMSIPLQQVARYVYYHEDELTPEDIEAIDGLLDYETMGTMYLPWLSDPIKNEYNNFASDEQRAAFWRTWLELGLKHPETYIAATLNNYHEYLYPTSKDPEVHILYSYDFSQSLMRSLDDRFHFYHYDSPVFDTIRNLNHSYNVFFQSWLPFSLFVSAPLYVWALIISLIYCLYSKKRSGLCLLLPLLFILLVLFVGPANGYYFRYSYPLAFTLPFILVILGTTLKPNPLRRPLRHTFDNNYPAQL